MIVLEIVLGVLLFGGVLFALTYGSAFLADVTGSFRLLFIERPYRQLFRLVRWVVAGLATAGVLVALE